MRCSLASSSLLAVTKEGLCIGMENKIGLEFCLSVLKPFEVKIMSGFKDNFCWDCLAGSSECYCSFCNSEAWLCPQHHLSTFPAQSSALAKSQCVPAGLLALSTASVVMECLCLGRERVPAGWLSSSSGLVRCSQ